MSLESCPRDGFWINLALEDATEITQRILGFWIAAAIVQLSGVFFQIEQQVFIPREMNVWGYALDSGSHYM